MNKISIVIVVTSLISYTVAHAEFVIPPKGAVTKAFGSNKPGTTPTITNVGTPDSVFISLGMGFNALKGTYVPNECIIGAAPNKTFGQGQLSGIVGRKRILAVSNMSENQDVSGTDAGFSFAYKLVSVGGQSGSTSSSFFNSVDQYARVYVREAVEGEALINPVWSVRGKQYLPTSAASVKNFTDKCGTHYVRAIYNGHLLDQTYRFKTSESTITTAGKNDLFWCGKNLQPQLFR